jgi:L-threonylcarbamoyladenylate synthase
MIKNPTNSQLKSAARALKEGNLVAFPTETVYGLGADSTNQDAVSRIYSIKGRPTDHPLIVHISSSKQLGNWAIDTPQYALRLAKKFWPGPMTLVLKRSKLAKDFITGGQDSVALRVPSHNIAQILLQELEKIGGFGIVAPSANRFGAVSPTSGASVVEELGKYFSKNDLILESGPCAIGIESTIVDCTKKFPIILRPGAITKEMVELLSYENTRTIENNKVRASGMFNRHYAPSAKVILNDTAKPGDGLIALAKFLTPKGSIRLSSPSNVEEFARDFYASLRAADKKGLNRVVVIEPSGKGLAEAIRDRIRKASN